MRFILKQFSETKRHCMANLFDCILDKASFQINCVQRSNEIK